MVDGRVSTASTVNNNQQLMMVLWEVMVDWLRLMNEDNTGKAAKLSYLNPVWLIELRAVYNFPGSNLPTYLGTIHDSKDTRKSEMTCAIGIRKQISTLEFSSDLLAEIYNYTCTIQRTIPSLTVPS